MKEGDGKMLFVPDRDRSEARRTNPIRAENNAANSTHEFVLATHRRESSSTPS